MIDGTFIDRLVESTRGPEVRHVDGKERAFLPHGWTEAQRPAAPKPEPVELGTLTGLIDYVKHNRDGLSLGNCVLHVVDPSKVVLRANLEDEEAQFRRQVFALATTAMVGPPPIQFGTFLDAETFTIALLYGFVSTEKRAELIELIASIKDNMVTTVVDDGVAQQVTVAGGVTLVGERRVPNPVVLAPFRTFREVEQPESAFLFRLKPGPNGSPKPMCALFEADGSVWKLTAMLRIAEYLNSRLSEIGGEVAERPVVIA